MSARNTRFVERVRCERTALSCVNNAFRDAPPLAALSGPAIGTWRNVAVTVLERTKVEAVSGLLRELSLRLDIQANNSREVFDSAVSNTDIAALLNRVRVECDVI